MTEESSTRCAKCGEELLPDGSCANCERDSALRRFHRDILLLVGLAVVAGVSYYGTSRFAQSNEQMKEELASSWYIEGQRQLVQGKPSAAVAAFRKANVNDRSNRQYTLALAHALEVAGQRNQAQQLLVQVRENIPEDPDVNVELARIAAQNHDVDDAVRYYHNALYGIWKGADMDAQRQAIRLELIDFLINQRGKDQALPEIMALAAHLPETVDAHVEIGKFFLRSDDPSHALTHFLWVLHHEPRNADALKGAGEASFELGHYSRARQWLSAASGLDQSSKEMLAEATFIVEHDPLDPRISQSERDRRLLMDFHQVADRVDACISSLSSQSTQSSQTLSGLQMRLQEQQRRLTPQNLKRQPALSLSTLDLIYEAETALSQSCGPLHGGDRALLLLTQKNRGTEQ